MKKIIGPRQRRQGNAAAASSGIIIGRVHKLMHGRQPIPERELTTEQLDGEISRLMAAVQASVAEIDIERDHLSQIGARDPLMILDMHRMMIADPELIDKAKARITETCINAEWALRQQMDAIHAVFEQIEDEYLRNRKDDIEQAGRRILRHLLGQNAPHDLLLNSEPEPHHQTIYVGDDFSVGDMVSMWRQGVAGVVTEQGGAGAHNIIIARGIGLPALVGATGILADLKDGDALILDAEQGIWILNAPEHEQIAYDKFVEAIEVCQQELQAYATQPSCSKDGHELKLMANIEFPEEMDIAARVGVDGIGLYRSEFLFINEATLPSEEQQFQQYVTLVRHMAGKPVTMRLLDIGGDKPWLYHELEGHEYAGANPAMGLRGIRWLLREKKLLQTQLRAMLRAGEEGPVQILIPMVTTCAEVERVRELAVRCHQSMGLSNPLSVGVMIEVPASVFIADELARASDFFSIGINDLMQYSLATDRTDEEVAVLYRPEHPAILELIRMTAAAAKKAGIPVSVCGELAANPIWTETFLNLDMHSLSMTLNKVLTIRRYLSRKTYQPIL
jgi:phosphotransferase system enzyme I (PtsI)